MTSLINTTDLYASLSPAGRATLNRHVAAAAAAGRPFAVDGLPRYGRGVLRRELAMAEVTGTLRDVGGK